jgi:hypothetical protein
VLDNPLVELMQDVRRDGKENVGVRKILPERMDNGFNARIFARLSIHGTTLIQLVQSIQDFC